MEPDNGVDVLTLKEKIGQMLIVGFGAGTAGEAQLRRVVEATAAGNVILFARNGSDACTASASACFARDVVATRTRIQPLVAIDQEGGIVARIGSGVVPLPGAMALSAGATLEEVRTLCTALARDLASRGIDWNLGPVLDVNVNPANPVIDVRSFGEEPERVTEYALAWFQGMRQGGVLACAKHFPGHGDTSIDSHLDLPLVPHSAGRLDAVELAPFRALIGAGIPAILTAHVRFPAFEPESLPATLSQAVIRGLLRNKLGFKGIVVTDCMEMKAISGRYPDAAVLAVEAGADMIMVSHTEELQVAAAREIGEAVRSGRIPESVIDSSVERILAAKAGLGTRPDSGSSRFRAGKSGYRHELFLPGMETPGAKISGPQTSRPGSLTDDSSSSSSLPDPESRAIFRDSSQILDLAARVSLRSLSPANLLPFPSRLNGGFYIDVLPSGFTRVEDSAIGPGSASPDSVRIPRSLTILDMLSSSGKWSGMALTIHPGRESIGLCADAVKGFLSSGSSRPVVLGLYNARSDAGQQKLLEVVRELCAESGTPFGIIALRTPYDTLLAPSVPGVCAYEYTPLSVQSVARFLLDEAIEARGKCPVTLSSLRAQGRTD